MAEPGADQHLTVGRPVDQLKRHHLLAGELLDYLHDRFTTTLSIQHGPSHICTP